ncbi:MAG: right-handed parallel beta-helix repeat-containing protein [Candidatus Tenebribacter burtonii]|nr:right-handed parallel beta-helix repeat-containing protein [Candidatus Tenebribacter burtonii]
MFFLSTLSLSATIINIPADQPTIQIGINVSVNTDTVLVQPGTYVENINYNGKLITVVSLFLTTQDTTYISQTIIDGNHYGSVVIFASNEDSTAVLTGFTITNGYTDEEEGGGIYCYQSNPSIIHNNITGNIAHESAGGGIYCENSSPHLENLTIAGNSAEVGGGICCSDNSNPRLVDVTIIGNSTSGGLNNYGGGICCFDNSSPILLNVFISNNTAHSGGGICCSNNSIPVFDSENRCNIYLNIAGTLGRDLYADNCENIDVIVDTFTVLQPDDFFAYPIDNFTFDILNAYIEQVDQDLYVSPDGSNNNSGLTVDDPLLTISCALVKILPDSTNTHTIHLSNGIYSPSGTGEMFPLYCRSYVSLIGEDETSTILDGEELSRILFCDNDNNFSIENITITNGYSYLGGGIYCGNSDPILQDVTITGNSAEYGGGISCSNTSNPSLENVTISGNSAEHGGGIDCYESSPSLYNVTISGNTANSGGGIYCCYNSNPSLVNVSITGNSTDSNGGAICCYESNPIIQNVIIKDNSAFVGGGINCSLSSNPYLINVLISGNSAEYGGGIYCNQSSPSLINVTISGNSSDANGGGFWCLNSNLTLVNCILWNDTPEEIYILTGSIIATYSDIQGSWVGEGNIDEDPLFVGTGEDPYSLLEDSPCIDSGIPDTTGLNLPPWDIIGNLRIWDGDGNGGAIIDMGAYEYGAPPYVEIDDNVIVQTPEVFLHQNYPNPFNPSTIINYSLKENSKVSLNIYNIKGQKVKQLVSDQLSAGQHSIRWDGIDDNGKNVSSGIYFYKLKTKGYVKTKRMVLLK